MKLTRRRFILISAAAGATGLTGARQPKTFAGWRGVALGAHADIRLVGVPQNQAEKMLDLVRAEIARLEQQFSLYRADSAVMQLNQTGQLPNPSADMLRLMSMASTLHGLTDGIFDPTIQPIWAAYARRAGKLSASERELALSTVGWNRVSYSASQVTLPAGGAVTFNGIAQGYITDRIVDLLRGQGLQNALVNVGEISAMGHRENAKGWRVRMGDDDGPFIALMDQAVATTAPGGTVFNHRGDSHLINPATAKPAQSPWINVSVVHKSAAFADGLSTAAAQMELEEIRDVISSLEGLIFTGDHVKRGRMTLTG